MKRMLLLIVGLVAVGAIAIFHLNHHKVALAINVDQDEDTDEMHADPQANLASVAGALPHEQKHYVVSSSTPQFVVLSFDGSKSVSMLDETLDFEQKLQAEGKPLHFTYFINGAYFLTKANASLYLPPNGQPAGTSQIGFSTTAQDIADRVREFNKAYALGNEIGSHSVGHFNGHDWSFDQWGKEFDQFDTILRNTVVNNSSVSIEQPQFLATLKGFRAPNLGVNDNLFSVLANRQFSYDASGVNSADNWPTKDTRGLWHIPLGVINLGTKRVVAMDYNLWMHQSGSLKKGTADWQDAYKKVVDGYTEYFNTNNNGNRAPVVIGGHFSKWNDGVYWEAMKTFAENVCGKPNVHCVTFKELVDYLNTTGVPASS